jgi:hypothetical protein
MAKQSKFNLSEFARGLRERRLTATVFQQSSTPHARVNGQGWTVDVWPTAGSWKWMDEYRKGTLFELMEFLDAMPSKVAAVNDVLTFKD